MYCSQCGAKNEDTQQFCGSCGARLGAEAAPAAGVAAPAAVAKTSNTGLWVAVFVLVLALVGIGMYALGQRGGRHATPSETATVTSAQNQQADAGTATDKTAADETATVTTEDEPTDKTQAEPQAEPAAEPKPAPVPAEDPVAEATVVLENYLAADLGHDGNEMAKYLAGSAGAQFRPEVQGQEDVTIHSKKVSGHTVKDANTIVFKVRVKWSPSDSNEVRSDSERYVVKRTTKGWKITSTPAYP